MKKSFHSNLLLYAILTCSLVLLTVMVKLKGSPFSITHPTNDPHKEAVATSQPVQTPAAQTTSSPTKDCEVAFLQPSDKPEKKPDMTAAPTPTATPCASETAISASPTAASTKQPLETAPATITPVATESAAVATKKPATVSTKKPAAVSTKKPTAVSTKKPGSIVTHAPSLPSSQPAVKPPTTVTTSQPTKTPVPTASPTPIIVPTKAPTAAPTLSPTKAPSSASQKYKDGLYTGYGNGREGTITVSVRIRGGKLYKISIVNHQDNPSIFNQATAILNEIIAAQSTNVDAISGATASSNGIKEAVKDALSKA